jgi:UDP-N-acetylmuramoylalanine--D-glutamate ligase
MERNWSGENVLIIGAARQGLALARYLTARGAQVTLNDQRAPDQMQDVLRSLQQQPGGERVRWALDGHPIELLNQAGLVCISGGVPLSLPIIAEAQRRGLPLTNDSQVFMEAVRAPVIGITGSAGKTTTTTLVGRMAEAAAEVSSAAGTRRAAWLGGNIGLPLVEYVGAIRPEDLVVVEFSSFQLELMTISPWIAAVLNVTPNHLDRHGTLEAYTAAKARILDFQGSDGVAVLNRDDPGAWELRSQVRGRLVSFGRRRPLAGEPGTFLENGRLLYFDRRQQIELMPQERIRLRGEHNLLNVLAACAIACAAGWPVEAVRRGVDGFTGVAHRLEYVATRQGADWYNDSIATAPERTAAAIAAFDEPLVLLLGGRDKNLPWDKLAGLLHERVDHVVVFGEAASKIQRAIGSPRPGSRLKTVQYEPHLQPAVQAAARLAEPGAVVLLSPGGTSFDEFTDFEERGERFREWVKALL